MSDKAADPSVKASIQRLLERTSNQRSRLVNQSGEEDTREVVLLQVETAITHRPPPELLQTQQYRRSISTPIPH